MKIFQVKKLKKKELKKNYSKIKSGYFVINTYIIKSDWFHVDGFKIKKSKKNKIIFFLVLKFNILNNFVILY